MREVPLYTASDAGSPRPSCPKFKRVIVAFIFDSANKALHIGVFYLLPSFKANYVNREVIFIMSFKFTGK